MQAISKGLEKVIQELSTSENDGPVSEKFRKVHKLFLVNIDKIYPYLHVFFSNLEEFIVFGWSIQVYILLFGSYVHLVQSLELYMAQKDFSKRFNSVKQGTMQNKVSNLNNIWPLVQI